MVGVLALAVGLEPVTALLVVAAVLTGQLSIGWSNDLIDLARDLRTGRSDKPLATGAIAPGPVRVACRSALAATVVLSLALGWLPGGAQLVSVAAGWAYNLRLKSTVWSWLPYAVAFGALAAVPSLALPVVDVPWWQPVVGRPARRGRAPAERAARPRRRRGDGGRGTPAPTGRPGRRDRASPRWPWCCC